MSEERNDLGELPNRWMRTTLENCAEILDRQRVPINTKERDARISGKSESELYPYYGATGQAGWIDDYLFDEELVLLGEDGAPFLEFTKDTAYIIKGKTWVNNHAHVLKAIPNIALNQHLCNYLNTFDYHDYVTGTTRLKLNQSMMRKIPVPLPPLPEQHRIVAKIEELFTQLDAGITALKQAQAQLKRYRQSVLKAAVEGELTKAWREAHQDELEPASVLLERILKERRERWEAEQLAKMEAKGKPPKDDTWKAKYKEPAAPDTSDLSKLPEGWCWATVGQVAKTALNLVDPKTMPNSYHIAPNHIEKETGCLLPYTTVAQDKVTSSKHRFYPGQILYSKIRPYLAKAVLVDFEGVCSADMYPINSFINSRFLHRWMLTAKFTRLASDHQGRTVLPKINQQALIRLPVPVPPHVEQQVITDEVERCLSIADEVEATIDVELKRADRLRQSILKDAFSGNLVPQDPDDEPASILLERIKADKAQ